MKIYHFVLLLALCGGVKSEANNGFNFQQPSSKWAFAQSYSWVSNYNSFIPPNQQSHEQAQNQMQQQQALQNQALQQQALQQEALQNQALQQQAFEQQALQQEAFQNQALQQQALQQQSLQQQALQNQALQQQLQQRVVDSLRFQSEKHALPLDRFNTQSNSARDYITSNERKAPAFNNLQNENVAPPSSARSDENTQEFVDEIVRKVIQQTRGVFALPTTRGDIEKIVRQILAENSSNIRDVNTNRISGYQDNWPISKNNRNTHGMNLNRNSLTETFDTQEPKTTYPVVSAEQYNPQAECTFNCVNSHRDVQPIAVAVANSFYPINRSTDPRVLANSFTYTSV